MGQPAPFRASPTTSRERVEFPLVSEMLCRAEFISYVGNLQVSNGAITGLGALARQDVLVDLVASTMSCLTTHCRLEIVP